MLRVSNNIFAAICDHLLVSRKKEMRDGKADWNNNSMKSWSKFGEKSAKLLKIGQNSDEILSNKVQHSFLFYIFVQILSILFSVLPNKEYVEPNQIKKMLNQKIWIEYLLQNLVPLWRSSTRQGILSITLHNGTSTIVQFEVFRDANVSGGNRRWWHLSVRIFPRTKKDIWKQKWTNAPIMPHSIFRKRACESIEHDCDFTVMILSMFVSFKWRRWNQNFLISYRLTLKHCIFRYLSK